MFSSNLTAEISGCNGKLSSCNSMHVVASSAHNCIIWLNTQLVSENALLRAVTPLDSSSLIPNLIPSYLSPNPRTNYTIMGM